MNKEEIKKILEIAVFAPSGDNSQPWKFIFRNDSLEIHSLPEKDNPVFNYRNRGTLIAHGALIENISIAAREYKYLLEIVIAPDPAQKNHTATIKFSKDESLVPDGLFEFIKKRVTNRKVYGDEVLSAESLSYLGSSASDINASRVEIRFTDKEDEKQKLGQAVSKNEIVMLENKTLHDFFYNDIRWTTKSERRLKTGLYLRTMELAPPKAFIFKLLQNWPIAKVLNRIGISKFIASENAKVYSSGSAISVIMVPDEDNEFILAGRAAQRFWLKATQLGLAVHPVTGIIYLAQRLMNSELREFSEQHKEVIAEAYRNITSVFPANDKVFAMLFRVGFAPKPGDTSSRLEPEIKFE